jgi:YidC/Oxa1 family membrane protein insertase
MQFFTDKFFEILVFLYQFTGSLGLAIIALTLLIRSILVPLTLPSLKARKKITEIQPELNKLKKKHGKNKQALQKAQLELYQKYNVNPLSGCIPQLVQLVVLIFLYRTLINFLGQDVINGASINSVFLWLDLTQPDAKYILPVVASTSQFILSLMISPGGEIRDIVPNKAKSKKVQQENKKEEDTAGMAASMQQQMLFIMPIMTVFIAARFPSGLAVYWVVTTLFSIGQQYLISGLGGLKSYLLRAKALFK